MGSPSGVYLFCAIRTEQPQNFGVERINGNTSPIYTLQYKDIGMVISQIEGDIFPERDNFLLHQRVVARVFEKFTVIPFSFGNIVQNEEDALLLIRNLYNQFTALFSKLENKIEVGLKVIGRQGWLDKEARTYPELIELSLQVQKESEEAAFFHRIRLGELAEQLLLSLQGQLIQEVHGPLAQLADSTKLNEVHGERVLLSVDYLIDCHLESKFDEQVNRLYHQWEDRVEFKYSGPWPPYNFVDVRLKLRGRDDS